MWRQRLEGLLAAGLVVQTISAAARPWLLPQVDLALFAALGLLLVLVAKPLRWTGRAGYAATAVDLVVGLGVVFSCGWIVVQSQPAFAAWHLGGRPLGDRAGAETLADLIVGVIGVLVVIEITRRAVGWAVPALSAAFLAYGYWGAALPDWAFPHRGYGVERLVSQSFLHGQGVFSTALHVMFAYVFLFVFLGALLEVSGATAVVMAFARRLLGSGPGAPAKIAVVASGLTGSLSGSAVANVATTGTFTIPLMKSAGLRPALAGGIEAAASSGGALVPPVMGAGAYMMLELVDPPTTYLAIIKAAMLPAFIYYLALFLFVHFATPRTAVTVADVLPAARPRPLAGAVFVLSLGALLVTLGMGYSVARGVLVALSTAVVVSIFDPAVRLGPRRLLEAAIASARGGAALIAASACVGIVLGVVTLTGLGSRLPSVLIPLAEQSLLLALVALAVCSLVLGMGLPSAVCYLLLAALVGPVLTQLGVPPLAAHFFIFYFGLMSMVTPPVALAGYTAASIAGAGIFETSFAAFRVALVGFVLPFAFVYRPQLLFLDPEGGPAASLEVLVAFAVAALGTWPLAAAVAGRMDDRPLGWGERIVGLVAAFLLLLPAQRGGFPFHAIDALGLVVLAGWLIWRRFAARAEPAPS
jgi:TRAP transporter 4TM/12TM fusion protein